jgi:hypothetical protein
MPGQQSVDDCCHRQAQVPAVPGMATGSPPAPGDHHPPHSPSALPKSHTRARMGCWYAPPGSSLPQRIGNSTLPGYLPGREHRSRNSVPSGPELLHTTCNRWAGAHECHAMLRLLLSSTLASHRARVKVHTVPCCTQCQASPVARITQGLKASSSSSSTTTTTSPRTTAPGTS